MAQTPTRNQYEVAMSTRWPRSRVEVPLGPGLTYMFDRNITNPAHPYCGRKTLHLTAAQARSLARDGWQLDPPAPPEPVPPPKEETGLHTIPLTIEAAAKKAEMAEAKVATKKAKKADAAELNKAEE